jgi:prepilin-type N-terminal cleavage/methylation domain-containing protein
MTMKRLLASDERGFTLPELMITVSMLVIVVAMFLGILENVNTAVGRQQARSISNDDARLAVARLDREIRSGNVLYNPADEADPHYTLRIYTQANATTETPSFQCVQWVIEDRQLLRRSWPPGEPESVGAWTVVAENVVNADPDVNVPAFSLDPDPNKGERTVDIVLIVDSTPDDPTNRAVRIETSLTGRNTSFGFPFDVCDPAPA